MSRFPWAIALVIPAPLRGAFEAFGQQLGHSGQEYTIPLAASSDAAEPTHWGLNSKSTNAFKAILEGTKPPGVSQALFDQLFSQVSSRIRPETEYYGGANFKALIAEQGLVVLSASEDED